MFIFSKGKCHKSLFSVHYSFRRKWDSYGVLAAWGQTNSYHWWVIRNIPTFYFGNVNSGAKNKKFGKEGFSNSNSVVLSMPLVYIFFITRVTKLVFSLTLIPGSSCSYVINRCQQLELGLKKNPWSLMIASQEVAVVTSLWTEQV